MRETRGKAAWCAAIAVMFGIAALIFTGMSMEIVCLPFLAVWFGYYAMCLFWQGRVPAN